MGGRAHHEYPALGNDATESPLRNGPAQLLEIIPGKVGGETKWVLHRWPGIKLNVSGRELKNARDCISHIFAIKVSPFK